MVAVSLHFYGTEPLALLAALYSLYLLYLVYPADESDTEKALPYTAVLVVCAIVLGDCRNDTGRCPCGPTMGMVHRNCQSKHKRAVNADIAKLEALSKRMEEAGKKLENAQQSGDQAAMQQAIKEMASQQESNRRCLTIGTILAEIAIRMGKFARKPCLPTIATQNADLFAQAADGTEWLNVMRRRS